MLEIGDKVRFKSDLNQSLYEITDFSIDKKSVTYRRQVTIRRMTPQMGWGQTVEPVYHTVWEGSIWSTEEKYILFTLV